MRLMIGRWLYGIFEIVFLLCILTQFYLAGMAIFSEASYWSQHVMFVHLFGLYVPILMILAALMAKVNKWDYVYILILFFLIFAMYFTANMGRVAPFIGSLHPIIGVFIFLMSSLTVYRSILWVTNRRKNR